MQLAKPKLYNTTTTRAGLEIMSSISWPWLIGKLIYGRVLVQLERCISEILFKCPEEKWISIVVKLVDRLRYGLIWLVVAWTKVKENDFHMGWNRIIKNVWTVGRIFALKKKTTRYGSVAGCRVSVANTDMCKDYLSPVGGCVCENATAWIFFSMVIHPTILPLWSEKV